MSLATGARFGSCEVIELLGTGGMGDVYRGRDLHLDRDVAIKVLPERFAFDAQRLARFESEARILASLNHPNIAVLYGIDESSGVQALLMELVNGETLADYLALRGAQHSALSIEEALAIAEQIAAALEAAHDHGVIHRDLKPSNVALRSDGIVKLLDFGLAKTFDSRCGGDAAALTVTAALAELSSPAGTIAYMSPEQLRCLPVDQRADIWAFGCVLYELLTGRRVFEAESSAELVADILRREPDLDALPPDLAPIVRRLLRRCLMKDRRQRLRNIGDAALDLQDARTAQYVEVVAAPTADSRRRLRRRIGLGTLAMGACVGAAVAGIASLRLLGQSPLSPQVVRSTLVHEQLGRINANESDRMLSITPDGSRIVIVGNDGTELFVRALGELEVASIVSTALGLRGPFTSPDGEWVGYVESNTNLMKVPISGGTPTWVVTTDGPSRGAAWTAEGSIVFATSNTTTGLQSVSASGGAVTVLTRPDAARGEADHVFPELLPDGRVLMTILPLSGRSDEAQLAVLDPSTGDWSTVLSGAYHGHYLESGHLAYVSRGELHAIAFDLDRLAVRGASLLVPSSLTTQAQRGFAQMHIAAGGTLAYFNAPPTGADRRLMWVDRDGRETPVRGIPAGPYAFPRLSPDGTRLAVYARASNSDLWVWDLLRDTPRRITFETDVDSWPIWLSNTELVYMSQRRSGLGRVYLQSADGRGTARQLVDSMNSAVPTGSAPDGSVVLLSQLPSAGANQRWALRMLKLQKPAEEGAPYASPEKIAGLDELSNNRHGTISPDGRWLAYDSDDLGGQLQIFVRPFPDTASSVWQVSADGGQQPHWSPGGNELFFLALDGTMMAVPVGSDDGTSLSAGTPIPLFAGHYMIRGGGHIGRAYDVAANGRRFVMVKEEGNPGALAQIVIVQNWTKELEQLLP